MLAKRLLTAFAAALEIAACNSNTEPMCNGDCPSSAGASGASGEAGASGSAGVGESAAGEGGATNPDMTSNPPVCSKNQDCDDGASCNGAEQCVDGNCQPGEAIMCPALSECSETTNNAGCSYPASERFIVYEVDDLNPWLNLVGTSITDLQHPTQVNLSQGANDAEFDKLLDHYWSPDGRRLIFPTLAVDERNGIFDQKFFWFDFDQPIEGQPRRLPDVPINEDYSVIGWSPDSNAVLIGRNDFGRVNYYAVRFTPAGAETALVPSDGQVELCSDDTTIAYEAAGKTHLAALWSSADAETVLPALLRGRSPDGNWLLLSDEQHAYLAKCALQASLEQLAGPAAIAGSWSSNSRYVFYSEQDWDDPYEQDETMETTSKTLHGFAVESAERHTPLIQLDAVSPSVNFEPAGTRFLYLAVDGQSNQARHLKDMARPEFDRVITTKDEHGAPIVPTLHWLGATGQWVYNAALDSQDDSSSFAVYSLKTSPTAQPRKLVTDIYEVHYSDDHDKMIWLETHSDNQGDNSQAYSLDLVDDQSKPHALFPSPIAGQLRFALYNPQARLLYREVDFPNANSEIFVVPEDFESEPVSVKRGSVVDIDESLSLQPRP